MEDFNSLANLSCTEKLVLALITRAGDVGVDRNALQDRINKTIDRLTQRGLLKQTQSPGCFCIDPLSFTLEGILDNIIKNNISRNSLANPKTQYAGSIGLDQPSVENKEKPKLIIPTTIVFNPSHEVKIEQCILLWNAQMPAKPFADNGSKTAGQTKKVLLQLLDGVFFDDKIGLTPWAERKFTVSEFETSVRRFQISVQNHDYLPKFKDPLRAINLFSFLHIPKRKNISRSYFLWYLDNEPELVVPLPDELCPKATKTLIRLYRRDVLGNTEYTPSRRDMEHFINASNYALRFILKNKGSIFGGLKRPTDSEIGTYLWDAVLAHTKDVSRVNPTWLSSDIAKNQFPAHLVKSGILRSNKHRGVTVGDRIENSDCQIPPELL